MTLTCHAHNKVNMILTANVIGKSLPFSCILKDEVILSNAKAMVIPNHIGATLVGCRTSVQSKIDSLGANPQGMLNCNYRRHTISYMHIS